MGDVTDVEDAIVDAIRDAGSWCGDQYAVDERSAMRTILSIPEVEAGLALLDIAQRLGYLAVCAEVPEPYVLDFDTDEAGRFTFGPTLPAAIIALRDALEREAPA